VLFSLCAFLWTVVVLRVLFSSYVYLLYYVCIAVLTIDAELLARSQYPECPATGHLDTGFSWFPCVYKRMRRWFPSFQVATTCLSCSPPDLSLLVTYSIFVYMKNNHCHRVITQLQLINIIIIIIRITGDNKLWHNCRLVQTRQYYCGTLHHGLRVRYSVMLCRVEWLVWHYCLLNCTETRRTRPDLLIHWPANFKL
jgi:hypothetical protein